MKAAAAILMLALAGCASAPEEPDSVSYDRLMRVARTTEAGGATRSSGALYARAHQQDPAAQEPLLAMARVAYAGEEYAQAVTDLEKAAEAGPLPVDATILLAKSRMALDQPDLALPLWDRVTRDAPSYVEGWNGRGVTLDMLGRGAEARAAYQTAMTVAPNDVRPRNNLAFSLILADRAEEAIPILEGIGAATSPKVRQNLALAYGLTGRQEEAERIAHADLTPAQVAENLAIYERLRGGPTS